MGGGGGGGAGGGGTETEREVSWNSISLQSAVMGNAESTGLFLFVLFCLREDAGTGLLLLGSDKSLVWKIRQVLA